MDKQFGLWKPENVYDKFGSKIGNDGAIVVGYSRKPSVGLFGYAENYGTLSALNTKKATSGLFGDEIRDYISYSRAYGKSRTGKNRIFGSTDVFLEKLPISILSMKDKEYILDEIGLYYEEATLKQPLLTDETDLYSTISKQVIDREIATKPKLVQAYKDYSSQASAYNPAYVSQIKAGKGPSGSQGIQIVVDGHTIKYDELKGSKTGRNEPGSLFFHSIEARANGGSVNNGRPYLVGERGPELFVPGQSGKILPHFAGGGPIDPMIGMTATMLMPILASMLPGKIAGQDISAEKNAAAMASMTYFSMKMIPSLAGMAGPATAAVVGFEALSAAFKSSDAASQKAAENIVKNYQNAADAIDKARFGTSNSIKTAINMQDIQLKTNYKLADSASKAKDSASQLAQSFDAIAKQSTLQKQIMAGQELAMSQYQSADNFGNMIRSALFGNSSQSNLSSILTGKGLGAIFPSLKAKDLNYYEGLAQSQEIKQITSKPKSFEDLTSTKYLANFSSGETKLTAFAQAALNSKTAMTLWNQEVIKSDPVLGRLNEQLMKTGTSFQTIIQLNQAFAAGFFESSNAMTYASTHMGAFKKAFKDYQDNIKTDTSKARADLAAAQAEADAANKAAAGDTFTTSDANKVKADEEAIKRIQKEMKARDDLYNAQMRNIDAQEKQMNLEADVVKARGSGDLVAMAVAKQNLQIQKTKDAMQAAKDRADRGSQSKIDALQAEIDKLNAKKTGTGTAASQIAAQKANQKVQAAQDALAAAMTGGGPGAKGIKDAFDKFGIPVAPPTPTKSMVVPMFKWPELPKFLKPSWWKEKLGIETPKWFEKLKIETPKWFESFKKFKWPEFKWPEIKLPAGLEKIFGIGKKVESVISSPFKAVTGALEKVGGSTIGKALGKAGKGLGALGAVLNTYDAYQNASKSGGFSIGELGKSTATSAAWGAALGTIVPGAGTVAGAASGALWGAGTDLAGQLLGLLFGGGKGSSSTKTTKVENKGKVENTNSGKVDNKNTGPSTNTNSGDHKTTNTGNHTVTNSGSHTVKNSGTHKVTNSAAVTQTHTGNTSVTASKSSITASGSSIAAGKSSISASGSGISAPNATISGPINAKVNVSVNVTTTTTKKANGGIIHAASGLLVGAGGPKSDSIPAMLSNGEYVVQADAVSKYGSSFMDSINQGTFDIDNGIGKYAPAMLNAVNSKSVSIPSYSMDAKRIGDMANVIGNSSSTVSNTINVYPPEGADANAVANIVIGKINQAMSKQASRRHIK